MPSRSLNLWATTRTASLDEIDNAHVTIVGTGPGHQTAGQQIIQAYVAMLSGQFQGFCRDLHSEAVDHLCVQPLLPAPPDPRLSVLRNRLTSGRLLDKGNPGPGNLGIDFDYFGMELWTVLNVHDPANAVRNRELEKLNIWRNAIAHHNFASPKLNGRTTVLLSEVRAWRLVCGELAADMDVVVGQHLGTLIGNNPW